MLDLAGRRLRPWQRFHVRTTALFAVPLFAILAVVGVVSWRRAVADEHALLRARLRALSVALAAAIEPAAIDPTPSPARARLLAALAAVGADQPEVVAVYVLVPDDAAGRMHFVADWDRRAGQQVVPGTAYDAAGVPLLMAAVRGPQVERDVVADAWGPTLSGYAPIVDAAGRPVAILGVDIAASTIAAREREAIVRALETARPGDVVVLAGKGHETYQVTAGRKEPFDDRLAPGRPGPRGDFVGDRRRLFRSGVVGRDDDAVGQLRGDPPHLGALAAIAVAAAAEDDVERPAARGGERAGRSQDAFERGLRREARYRWRRRGRMCGGSTMRL